MTEQVRVRFAPSPTGPLHIGGARSALFNYLLARRTGGQFIVRIEDTDLERSSRESEENILDSLAWLGITWDEGVRVGGPHAPYRQTERLNTYRDAADKLIAAGKAYRCYCSEEELEAERQAFSEKGELPRYSGKCRCLTPDDEQRYQAEGRRPVLRFRVPDEGAVVIDDQVRGQVTFECEGIGDFIIVKSDGIPTYNFAVVIDDALMDITHVVRGEEHLSNTPRQVLIYEALGLKQPRFAHVSLILGKDRSKMSKRHGSTSVVAYQSQGYLPEALINFLVLLGWSPAGEEEIFSLEALCEQFSLERVAKSPAVFDADKLNWLNGMYIRQAAPERIRDLALPFLIEAGYVPAEPDEVMVQKVGLMVQAIQEKLVNLGEVTTMAPLFFGETVQFESEEAKAVLAEEQVPVVLQAFLQKLTDGRALEPGTIKAIFKEIGKETKHTGRKVFMPVRVALTGQMHGPELHFLIPALGSHVAEVRVRTTAAEAGLAL
ncbi:glutamate--tRNA ligase [Heliophilum fasciatum]|uniref:Glutamate--tRNA ligase n=1 Tax=Heliophilum fasciatum TaxID=35700 RepID=A0A4R2RNS3_9FIRM|nr:glutamate--tRNA ligase [Heliophilum fasciatum]MCW2277839.1 nondiscriminating glutamyl-tRNA synthetase [Heliophilum fasciatum]TCP64668.1 glutamyl-tRNA synthetase /glutamate--tRNA(Gln) ligase [Heliophilum fasciatum]